MRYAIVTITGDIFRVKAEDMLCNPIKVMQWPGGEAAISFKENDRQVHINRDHIVTLHVELTP